MPTKVTLSEIRNGRPIYRVESNGEEFTVVDEEGKGRKAATEELKRRHGVKEYEPPAILTMGNLDPDGVWAADSAYACSWDGCGNGILLQGGVVIQPDSAVTVEDRIYCREFCKEADERERPRKPL